MEPSHWRTVHDSGGDLLLGISFDTGRGESLLTDLADGIGDHGFLEVVPPGPPNVDLVRGLPGYLDPWLEDLNDRHSRIVGIIGHCAGASLAAALAARLREAGSDEAAVFLIDPAEVDASTVATEYRLALQSLTAFLAEDELRQAQQAADGPAELTDLLPMIQRLDSAYRVALSAACQRLPVSAEYRDQLGDRLSRYLLYLTASRWATNCATTSMVTPAAVALPGTSDVAPGPSDAVAASDATLTVRFGTDRAHLLADPALADLISKTLGR